MAFKHKYSYEEKEHIPTVYRNNACVFRKLFSIYGRTLRSSEKR